MKKILLMILFSTLSTAALANNQHLNIVNHYNKALNFTIGLHPEVLADLPKQFTLQKGSKASSTVLDNDIEAYIRAEDVSDANKSAFWGVEVLNNQLAIYGYAAKQVAFSWSADTVTFCTPAEYQKKGHC